MIRDCKTWYLISGAMFSNSRRLCAFVGQQCIGSDDPKSEAVASFTAEYLPGAVISGA